VIRLRSFAALSGSLLAAAIALPAAAQTPSPDEGKLAEKLEAQQADIADQEARLADLEKQIKELQKKLQASEKAAANAQAGAPGPASAAPISPPPSSPPPSAPLLGLPDFLRDFTIGGYLQGQYENHQDSQDQLQQGGDPLNQNRFLLRRARLKIEKEWQYASAMIELDGNTVRGPALGVQHAEASLVYRGQRGLHELPILKLTVGLFDVPFGYELTESPRKRFFMERSLLSRAFFPAEPDLGVRLSAALAWFRATVAITNGEPLGERTGFAGRDPNDAKDLVARVGAEFSPVSQLRLSGGVSVLTGKGFSPGTDVTKGGVVQWHDTNEDGFIGVNELTAVPSTTGLPSQSFQRWAVGGDVHAQLDSWLGATRLDFEVVVANNMDRGLFIANPILTGIDNREIGFMIGATQEILNYGVVGFRYDSYDPNGDAQDLRGGKLLPVSQTVQTFSPLVGLQIPDRARLIFQYDVIRDALGRDPRGVPTDLRNDTWTLRLQGAL
jgi:hypothetical protein